MRKFLFMLISILFICSPAFAENNPLKIIEVSEEISENLRCDFSFFPVRYYGNDALADCNSNVFENYLNPDFLDSDNIVYDETNNLYTVGVPFFLSASQVSNGYVTDEAQEYLVGLYNRFVLKNPEYFYLVTESFSFSRANVLNGYYYVIIPAIVCHDFPEFDGSAEAIEGLRTKYNRLLDEIDNACNALYFDQMTDLDKLLLAHDYVTDSNVYYTDSSGSHGDGYSYNAYGALVNKQCVCQGYATAYYALLKELGFNEDNIDFVLSVSGNTRHIWNIVRLDGKWYHVDATWDDPTYNNYDMYDLSKQRTSHKYFLTSTATRLALKNESVDMFMYGCDNSIIDSATDTTYESGYIFNSSLPEGGPIYGAFSYDNGRYVFETDYYVYSNSRGSLKFVFDSLKACDYALSQPYFLETIDNVEYYTSIDSLNDLNGRVYFKLFSGNSDANITKQKNFVLCFYDRDGRLLKNVSAKTSNTANLNTFSSANFPINTYSFKVFCLDDLTPLSNTIILTR